MMWSPGLHHLKESDNQVLKKLLSPSMRWVIRRQIPTWYLYPRLIVANTREIAKKLRVNSTRLKRVVLAYSLPVAGHPDLTHLARYLYAHIVAFHIAPVLLHYSGW